MTTKRNLKREVEDLKHDDGDGNDPLVFAMTHLWPAEQGEDAEPLHPALTVQQYPEEKPDSYKIATPNLLPDEYASRAVLSVVTCANADRHGFDRSSNTVTACELWEPLTEDELRAEKRVRQANDEPIPPLLEEYDVAE